MAYQRTMRAITGSDACHEGEPPGVWKLKLKQCAMVGKVETRLGIVPTSRNLCPRKQNVAIGVEPDPT